MTTPDLPTLALSYLALGMTKQQTARLLSSATLDRENAAVGARLRERERRPVADAGRRQE